MEGSGAGSVQKITDPDGKKTYWTKIHSIFRVLVTVQ